MNIKNVFPIHYSYFSHDNCVANQLVYNIAKHLTYIVLLLHMHIVTFNATIITIPTVDPIPGSNNTFEYFAGTDLFLTCSVTPDPPFGSQYNWNCSTGCFADMEMERTIQVTDLEEMDSGVVSCSVSVYGMEYVSESIEIAVIEGMDVYTW